MQTKKVYSLYQLSKSIQNVLKGYADQSYWVKAEILKLNYYEQSGHAYPDLVDKTNDTIQAQFRGTIWSYHYQKINEKFRQIGERLKDDMQLVMKVSVNYHSIYGLTLNILDVDTNYTLGELAKQRQDSIKRLKSENLFDRNKSTFLAVLPKNIAVISVDSSKGYKDFIDVLKHNPKGYSFHLKLFPAVLQGDKAVTTISRQIKYINKYAQFFDAIAIVRGGGDEVGLSAYDNYNLAKCIAESALPVLSGIGHSTNKTIAEMVSYKSFITPTKIAAFFVERFEFFDLKITEFAKNINKNSSYIINQHKYELDNFYRVFQSWSFNSLKYNRLSLIQVQDSLQQKVKKVLKQNISALEYFEHIIRFEVKEFIKIEEQSIEGYTKLLEKINVKRIYQENTKLNIIIEQLSQHVKYQFTLNEKSLDNFFHQLRLQDPRHILKRGFSLTRVNGKLVKGTKHLKQGDIIETYFYKGKTESEIKNILK